METESQAPADALAQGFQLVALREHQSRDVVFGNFDDLLVERSGRHFIDVDRHAETLQGVASPGGEDHSLAHRCSTNLIPRNFDCVIGL